MTTSSPTFENLESNSMDNSEANNMDWSTVSYGSDGSLFWWRIFIWILTLIAIFGMAAALFWWQIDRGIGPSSTLSPDKVVRTSSTPRINHPDYGAQLVRFPKPGSVGNFMVLAGSFVNDKNAERIYNILLQAGIPVRAKQAMVNGQHHTHLLVGPYQRQDSAELAVSLIRERTGLPVDYTSLEEEEARIKNRQISNSAQNKEREKSATLHPNQFIVLAGSFTTYDMAERVQKRLKLKNIPTDIKEVHEQDRTFFHVMAGPYGLSSEANEMVETIRKKTGILAESSQIM
jgi:cell division septation protein DedD